MSISSPERTAFTLVPLANDLEQYSASHPSQMAKVTGRRTPQRFDATGVFDAPGRLSLLPHPSSPIKQYSTQMAFNVDNFDFESQSNAPNSLQSIASSSYVHHDAMQEWSTLPEGGALPMDSVYLSRPVNEVNGLPFSDSGYSSNGSNPANFYQHISPAMACSSSVSESLIQSRASRNDEDHDNSSGGQSSLASNSVLGNLGVTNQYTSESESDLWTPSTLFSERSIDTNSSSTSGHDPYNSSGATSIESALDRDNHQPYHDSSKGNSNAHYPHSTDVLPAISSLEPRQSCFSTRPSEHPSYPSRRSVSAGKDAFMLNESPLDISTGPGRGYRLLQPQPQCHTDRLPSFADAIENGARHSQKFNRASHRPGKKLTGC